jgi:hypothetical protein
MKQNTLLIELHYLPCIQYFTYLHAHRNVIIDLAHPYTKQTYRNRCRINGANNVEDLIIPIRKGSSGKIPFGKIEIDYEQKWLNRHRRAIQSAYGKAPFYEYYKDELFEVYEQKPTLLSHLNQALLTKCLEIIDLNIEIEYVENFEIKDKNSLYNAINEISPKKTICEKNRFNSIEYFQVFGNNFAPNLSIADLIFCEGPGAGDIIRKSSAFE